MFRKRRNNKKKINDFCKNLENKKQKILSDMFKFGNVTINFKYRGELDFKEYLGKYNYVGGAFGVLVGINYITLIEAILSIGVVFLLPILGYGIYMGVNKIIKIFGKKKDIEESFESFFENFNAIKVKLKDQIEKIYNDKIKEIDDILKSQNIIYKDINKWNKIIDKFLDLKMIFVDKFK